MVAAIDYGRFVGNHAGKDGCGGDCVRPAHLDYRAPFGPGERRNHCLGCGEWVRDGAVITPEEAALLAPGQEPIGRCPCGGIRYDTPDLAGIEAAGEMLVTVVHAEACTECSWGGGGH